MNEEIKEREIIEAALDALLKGTGLNGRILAREINAPRHNQPDAIIEITAEEKRILFVAEVKRADRVQMIGHIKAQLERTIQAGFPLHQPLLITPYMTRQLAEECRLLDLPFIDTAGNAFIRAPGTLFYITGCPRPEHEKQILYRANTALGLRITFALLCDPTFAEKTYREIANFTGVAIGTIGPVLKDLERRGFLYKGKRENFALKNAQMLFNEWLALYPGTLRPKLHPRRYYADPERLMKLDLAKYQAYWGGEMAAQKLTQYLKPERFTIYARGQVQPILLEARMRLDPEGNTEILDAFWPPEIDEAEATLAPTILVYADLMLTGDARNIETAKIINEKFIEPTHRP